MFSLQVELFVWFSPLKFGKIVDVHDHICENFRRNSGCNPTSFDIMRKVLKSSSVQIVNYRNTHMNLWLIGVILKPLQSGGLNETHTIFNECRIDGPHDNVHIRIPTSQWPLIVHYTTSLTYSQTCYFKWQTARDILYHRTVYYIPYLWYLYLYSAY